MQFSKAYVPYGGYWSTPFSKWQMSLQSIHPLKLAGEVGKETLGAKGIDTGIFDEFILGWTITSKHSLYGGPWVAAMCGMDKITGSMIAQACATSARCIYPAGRAGESDSRSAI